MLARRLGGILPPLTRDEALEVTRIHSLAGLRRGGGGLIAERPFRAPHHTISSSGLVGGGAHPGPGEASLAHHGVLFLDELSEFARSALEALRQPLEDRQVTIVRGQRAALLPTSFMLVAATNPCPCGRGNQACECTTADHNRHRRRLSGPLLDRIDLHVGVERPDEEMLTAPPLASSAAVREEVLAARERQAARLAGTGASCNADMPQAVAPRASDLPLGAREALRDAYADGTLSARGHGRVLRVARTIADLEGRDRIEDRHVLEAIGLRRSHDLERKEDRACCRLTSASPACGARTCSVSSPRASSAPGAAGRRSEGCSRWTTRTSSRRSARATTARVHLAREAFDADGACDAIAAAGLGAVCRHGSWYPAPLMDLEDAPAVLHVAGDPGLLADLRADEGVACRRSRWSARAARRPTDSTSPRCWAAGSRPRGSASSAAWRSASTPPPTPARWRRRVPRSRCSPAAPTGRTPPASARSTAGSRPTAASCPSCRRGRGS